jgi:hypothetical protein
MVDTKGSLAVQARESYWHKATGGIFSASALAVGEGLLRDTGMLFERGERLFLSSQLEEMLDGSIDDAIAGLALEALCLPRAEGAKVSVGSLSSLVQDEQKREELLLARAHRFDDSVQRLTGEIGEELVVSAAREELLGLGREDLARAVRRVSLTSDALGYDVNAPRLTGRPRLLEVKSTTRTDDTFRVFISRNEANIGAKFPDWAMVVCRVTDLEMRSAEICGWCPAHTFSARLPTDSARGRWEQASIGLRAEELHPGLPLPTL